MTLLELIMLMYDSAYKLPYHPPPPETEICVDYNCDREIYIGCIEEFNILICPKLEEV